MDPQRRRFVEWDNGVSLELQPGDGTRYRVFAVPLGPGRALFAATIPHRTAEEYEPRGPAPRVADEPFCRLNPFTAAIYADVVRAVVFGLAPTFYDFDLARPRAADGRRSDG